jgi:hypothetical protein
MPQEIINIFNEPLRVEGSPVCSEKEQRIGSGGFQDRDWDSSLHQSLTEVPIPRIFNSLPAKNAFLFFRIF